MEVLFCSEQCNLTRGGFFRLTIMGESAGSWSVTGHLVANNGDNEGLCK